MSAVPVKHRALMRLLYVSHGRHRPGGGETAGNPFRKSIPYSTDIADSGKPSYFRMQSGPR